MFSYNHKMYTHTHACTSETAVTVHSLDTTVLVSGGECGHPAGGVATKQGVWSADQLVTIHVYSYKYYVHTGDMSVLASV